jgi:hypothetical protein
MSLTSYFNHFPKTKINDQQVVDLFTNVTFVDQTMLSEIKTEPFEVLPEDDAEQIANFLYEDPYYFYVILLVNNIINPYDEWILDNNEFNRVIVDQYQEEYLTKHKDRVVSLIHSYFDQFYTFEFSQKVPQGKYYLRITHADAKSHGPIKVDIDIRSHIESATENQIYSNVTFNYTDHHIESQVSLIDTPYAMTKIYVPNTSHVQIDTAVNLFIPFMSQEIDSANIYVDQFPFHTENYIHQQESLVIEIEHMFPIQELYISGMGTHINVELYTINGLLVFKTSSGKTERVTQVLNSVKKIELTKMYAYESDTLYAYSSKLISSIIEPIYNQQKATHFLNFSLDEFKSKIIQAYLSQFSPVMYDILIDYSNKMVNSEVMLTEYNKKNTVRVKCASNFNINIRKPPVMIDNIQMTKNSLVLIKNQDNAEENGVYKFNEKGFFLKDESIKIYPRMNLFVEQGIRNQQTEWFLNNKTKNVITKNDELHFAQNIGVLNATEQTSSYFVSYINNLMSSEDYHYYAYDIYNETHHWETLDTSSLGAEVTIDETFVDPSPKSPVYKTRITNFDHENKVNDAKKTLKVLKPTYLENYVEQLHALLKEQSTHNA